MESIELAFGQEEPGQLESRILFIITNDVLFHYR